MAENRSQRTERPTAKKLLDARQKGNVPRSKEISSAAVLGMFLIFCHLFGPDWLRQMKGVLVFCLSEFNLGDLDRDQGLALAHALGTATAKLMFLPVGMLAAASVAGQLVQGPPLFTLKPLTPDGSKFNPIQGLKKMFSRKSMVSLAKALLNTTIFTTIAVTTIRDALANGLPGSPGVEGTAYALFVIADRVLFRIVVVWFVLAAFDLLFTRHDYFRNLMMTKQEVKDERKQMEGDPRVRSRIRSKQLELARSRMMAAVPEATVVVTNPTHIAVALRYVPGEMDVPLVVAKGRALIAQRIREVAQEHNVPIVRDPPLARSIYRSVPVGGSIPIALFRAVAEVLGSGAARTSGQPAELFGC